MGIFDKDEKDAPAAPKADANLQFTNSLAQKVIGTGVKLDGFRVNFAGGVATVTGRAANFPDRDLVTRTLQGMNGVTRVDNQLLVGTASGTAGAAGAPGKPGSTYTVVAGDTLSEIAQKHYGAASRWKDIFEANRGELSDPDKIKVGQVLNLP